MYNKKDVGMNQRGALKMPSPIAFDTLAFANKLKAAGVDPKAAEAQSEATAEILTDLVNSQLATKSDIGEIKKEVEILNVKFDSLNAKLTWLVSLIGIIGAVLAFVNLWHMLH